jgi:hypothetical protein
MPSNIFKPNYNKSNYNKSNYNKPNYNKTNYNKTNVFKSIKKTDEFNLNDTNFPSLNNCKEEENINCKEEENINCKEENNYSDIVKKYVIIDAEKLDDVEPGHVLLTLDKNAVIKKYSTSFLQEEIDRNNYSEHREKVRTNIIINNIIDKWDNYRKEYIELNGEDEYYSIYKPNLDLYDDDEEDDECEEYNEDEEDIYYDYE